MRITLINNSSDDFSYLSGAVVVPAGGSITADMSNWFSLYSDVAFMTDIRNSNLVVSDGVHSYQYPDSETYLRRAISEDNEANRDVDGALIVRNKAARRGWTFCALPLEFQTARLSDTLFSQDHLGNNRSFITMKAYDDSGNEVTTAGLAGINYASIVKTVVDFEPPYDYEVIGGSLRILTDISADMRVWMITAPDIPAPIGSKELGGGINLKYLSPANVWDVDGRVAKAATYNAQLHSNKIRIILKYPAGTNHSIQVVIQHYRQ